MTQTSLVEPRPNNYRVPCPICDFNCPLNNLQRHVRYKHPEEWEQWDKFHYEWDSETPFLEWIKLIKLPVTTHIICYVCGGRIHVTEVPKHMKLCENSHIKCPWCERYFLSGNGLALHTRSEHKDIYATYMTFKQNHKEPTFIKFIQSLGE